MSAVTGGLASGQSSVNTPVPAGVVASERVILFACGQNIATPTGFATTALLNSGGQPHLLVATKTATGADSGSYTSSAAFLANADGIAFRPNYEHPGSTWFGTPAGGTRRVALATTEAITMTDPGEGALLFWVATVEGSTVTTAIPSGYTRVTANSALRMHVATRTHPGGSISVPAVALGASSTSRTILSALLPTQLRDGTGGLCEAHRWNGTAWVPAEAHRMVDGAWTRIG